MTSQSVKGSHISKRQVTYHFEVTWQLRAQAASWYAQISTTDTLICTMTDRIQNVATGIAAAVVQDVRRYIEQLDTVPRLNAALIERSPLKTVLVPT